VKEEFCNVTVKFTGFAITLINPVSLLCWGGLNDNSLLVYRMNCCKTMFSFSRYREYMLWNANIAPTDIALPWINIKWIPYCTVFPITARLDAPLQIVLSKHGCCNRVWITSLFIQTNRSWVNKQKCCIVLNFTVSLMWSLHFSATHYCTGLVEIHFRMPTNLSYN
jgi:hypothetical protein